MSGPVYSLPRAIAHARKCVDALTAVLAQMPAAVRHQGIPVPNNIELPPAPDINSPECWIPMNPGKCADLPDLRPWLPPRQLTLDEVQAAVVNLGRYLAGIQASLESL